jgi:hypothetical protein
MDVKSNEIELGEGTSIDDVVGVEGRNSSKGRLSHK